MAVSTKPQTRLRMTAGEFDAYALLPENRERRLEYIAGEVIELVSNDIASQVSARVNGFLFMYLHQNDIGVLTGSDGGYKVDGYRYIPDVGFIRHDRRTTDAAVAYYPVAPDLVAEVISDPDNAQERRDLMVKVSNYLAANTVVWVLDWSDQRVEVHTPGQSAQVLYAGDTLSGDSVLPGFHVAVADLFPAAESTTKTPDENDT